MKSKGLIKNTVIYALGDIVPKLLGFISFPILTKYLSPSDYGVVNYTNTLGVFLLAIGFLCTNTYYLVFYYRCEDDISQKRLLGNLSSFIIAYNAILLIVLGIFGQYLFGIFGSQIPFFPFIFICVLANFFNIFSILPSALYRLLEKPMFLTIVNVFRGVITLIVTLILVIFYDYKALGVLYSTMFVNLIFVFIFLYSIRKHVIWNFNIPQIKKILVFSLPLVPGTLAYYITTISDRILIDKYLSLNDLGIYSTAATLALILNIFSYGAYKAFEPYIFKNWGLPDFKQTFEKIHNSFIYILLIGVLGLSLFSEEFFKIMTSEKFYRAYWYVPMIIIGVYSASLNMLYSTIITAKEKTKVNSIISIIGASISIFLNVWLLPKFGLIMAAVVSSFAMSIMLLISIYYSKMNINHWRHAISLLLVTTTIYIFVYVMHFDTLLLSIIVKTFTTILAIALLSFTLSINPLKAINNFIKK